MTQDVNRERLDRLREDLAALRARTTAEFGLPPTPTPAADGGSAAPTTGRNGARRQRRTAPTARAAPEQGPETAPEGRGPVDAVTADPATGDGATRGRSAGRTTDGAAADGGLDDDGWLPRALGPVGGRPSRPVEPIEGLPPRAAAATPQTTDRPRPRSAGAIRRPRPPRPPRRLRRPKVRRPPKRLAVPTPIEVRRRPSYLAAPRWPVWTLVSGLAVAAVMLPAVGQLTYRLLMAMRDTSVLMGADPSRADHLHAAAGVAGGGVTLALAVGALALVKGRPGYLAAAGAVLTVFCVFPWITHTAIAGVIAAPLPPFAQMVSPPRWGAHAQLQLTLWLCGAALAAAVVDLLVRSATAVGRTVQGRRTATR